MNWWVGTSGYSYKEWKGSFYPEKLPAKDMLAHYGTKLTGVEINNTFYRLPRADVLTTWASQVPESFRFVLKASRRITHFSRLKESAAEPTQYLVDTASALGDRLGCFLFQLPPNFKADVPRLEAFLQTLPPGTRAAFEFRHDSWQTPETHDVLRAAGAALCLADADDADEPEFVSTTDFGYLRLRRTAYDEDALARWHEQAKGAGWTDAFVFFKHEDEGTGPRLAGRFLERARA